MSSWWHVEAMKSEQSGAQIDLVIDRNDDAITLCEIKYSENVYTLAKAAAKSLLQNVNYSLLRLKLGNKYSLP
jgi:hypothetical protein